MKKFNTFFAFSNFFDAYIFIEISLIEINLLDIIIEVFSKKHQKLEKNCNIFNLKRVIGKINCIFFAINYLTSYMSVMLFVKSTLLNVSTK